MKTNKNMEAKKNILEILAEKSPFLQMIKRTREINAGKKANSKRGLRHWPRNKKGK